jgi:hypothetical protein
MKQPLIYQFYLNLLIILKNQRTMSYLVIFIFQNQFILVKNLECQNKMFPNVLIVLIIPFESFN